MIRLCFGLTASIAVAAACSGKSNVTDDQNNPAPSSNDAGNELVDQAAAEPVDGGDGGVIELYPTAPAGCSSAAAPADVTGLDEIDTSVVTGTTLTECTDASRNVAFMRVNKLTIDKPLTVRGSRPLIIFATDRIDIRAMLDVGAHDLEPGPGGYRSQLGPGAGNFSTSANGSGSGAGHATIGAAGQASPNGGVTYSMAHVGGSGGGKGPNGLPDCGGGGGGAIMLIARNAIQISETGGIRATGGNGSDFYCGGGSGGRIALDARAIIIRGNVNANGGNGGRNANEGGAFCFGRGGSIEGPPMGVDCPGGGAAGFVFLRGRESVDHAYSTISPEPTK